MLKILLFAILILLIFSILLIILIKNKKQAIQIYSLQTFLGSSSNSFEDEPNEQKKSFIDTINDFFKDDNDVQMDDDHGDPGDDDAGE
ncbi:hypothetical protein ACIQAA_23285 [Neobacillus sp. NPDC093182]|uniref:hypothetical protein n=1 Tax=Neobacillus sp. NPDC093182 TaxID=3364297 RepID=UPI0037FC1B66